MDTRGHGDLKRRDMGFASVVIVIAQIISSIQSTENVSSNLSNEISNVRIQLDEARSHQEKYFVKREELDKVVAKIDSMNSQLKKIKRHLDIHETISGCSSSHTDWRNNYDTHARRERINKTHPHS